jgi:hypothetical protein
MIPPQLMELFIQKSQWIARGETDWRGAALDFFEPAVADKDHWLIGPASYPRGWRMWAVAEGQKKRQKSALPVLAFDGSKLDNCPPSSLLHYGF